MSSFVDNKGETWPVYVTFREILAVQKRLGINLGGIVENGNPQQDLAKLVNDIEKFLDVLYICCEQQAKEIGLSKEDFLARMDFDIFNSACNAFAEAYVNFTQPGRNKDQVRAIMAQRAKSVEKKIGIEQDRILDALKSLGSVSDLPA